MSKLTLYGRPVVDAELELAGVDSFFTAAAWDDTGEPLDDGELSDLTDENGDYIVTENCERFGYFPK